MEAVWLRPGHKNVVSFLFFAFTSLGGEAADVMLSGLLAGHHLLQ
jgi:hypothetical protein